ncbi:MAG: hypothetical protein ACR2I5_08550 [Candidatus Limnocylindria bacterium]
MVLGLWAATALILGAAALIGNLLLADAAPQLLGAIEAIAVGAVIASLATEVFPQAFRDGSHETGIAAGLGLVIAFALR